MGYNVKVIKYDSEIQVNFYEHGVMVTDKHFMTDAEKKELKEKNVEADSSDNEQFSRMPAVAFEDRSELNKARSLRRSKNSIYEIARANEFDYFATFTFAGGCRYEYDLCKEMFRQWLKDFQKRRCKIEYIAVPEQHKDTAWHFHAMIKGDMSSHIVPGIRSGTYTIPSYTLGRNEIEPIRDSNRCASYITKYITKDLAFSLHNKRRYFYSRGLKKPEVLEFSIDENRLFDFIQGNFSEYTMTYQRLVETHGQRVNYIQLAKTCVDDADT